MRIAIDASPLIGLRTGIGVFVQRIIEHLPDATSTGQPVELQEYTLSLSAKRRGQARGSWVPLPAGRAPTMWRRFGGPRIERFTGPVDLVHGTNYLVPPARAPRLVSVYDLSYVHDADRVAPHVARFDAAVRWAIDGGAVVHTMSHFVADEIRERYGALDVVVVPGGVVAPASPVGTRELPDEPVVLALGTTGPRKNIPLLVEAFGRLPETLRARLRIVGPPGEDEPAVRSAMAALNPRVAGRIARVGPVDDSARDDELAAAAVLAHPTSYEGFGFPVLEAMAVGTPVVTTTGGSLAEVAADAAELVAVNDVDALTAALERLLTDRERWAARRDSGHRRSAEFAWGSAAAEMLALYERVAG